MLRRGELDGEKCDGDLRMLDVLLYHETSEAAKCRTL